MTIGQVTWGEAEKKSIHYLDDYLYGKATNCCCGYLKNTVALLSFCWTVSNLAILSGDKEKKISFIHSTPWITSIFASFALHILIHYDNAFQATFSPEKKHLYSEKFPLSWRIYSFAIYEVFHASILLCGIGSGEAYANNSMNGMMITGISLAGIGIVTSVVGKIIMCSCSNSSTATTSSSETPYERISDPV